MCHLSGEDKQMTKIQCLKMKFKTMAYPERARWKTIDDMMLDTASPCCQLPSDRREGTACAELLPLSLRRTHAVAEEGVSPVVYAHHFYDRIGGPAAVLNRMKQETILANQRGNLHSDRRLQERRFGLH